MFYHREKSRRKCWNVNDKRRYMYQTTELRFALALTGGYLRWKSIYYVRHSDR